MSNACRFLGIGADIWLAQYDTKYSAPPPPPPTSLETVISEIDAVAKALPEKGVAKKKIGEAISSVCGTPNYNKITDDKIAREVLTVLKNLGGNKE